MTRALIVILAACLLLAATIQVAPTSDGRCSTLFKLLGDTCL